MFLAKPERFRYISGPDDDVPRILRQLAAASGRAGSVLSERSDGEAEGAA
jgi:hypothetical protein